MRKKTAFYTLLLALGLALPAFADGMVEFTQPLSTGGGGGGTSGTVTIAPGQVGYGVGTNAVGGSDNLTTDGSSLTAAGTVSAANFVGNGSGLTGLAAVTPTWGSISGTPAGVVNVSNTTGDVTATRFAGSISGTSGYFSNVSGTTGAFGTVTSTNVYASAVSGTIGTFGNINTGSLTATGTVSANALDSFFVSGTSITGVAGTFTGATMGTLAVSGVVSAGTVSASTYTGNGAGLATLNWYALTPPTGVVAISSTALTTAILGQLQNIGANTIGSTQWGNVASLNQSVSSTATPTFGGVTLTGTTTATSINASGTVSATAFVGSGAGLTNLPAGSTPQAIVSGTTNVTVNGTTNTISFTTNGTNAAYIDATGREVVAGISVTTNQTSVTTLSASGAVTITSVAGQTTGMTLLGNVNNFYQYNCKNSSNGSNASCDYVATADDGSDTTHYADFGINNSGGSQSPFNNAHAAYLYNIDNELDLGAAQFVATAIISGTTPTEVMRVTSLGVSTTGSISATGTISASSFYGDGSHLTGIAGSGATDRITSGTTLVVANTSGYISLTAAGITNTYITPSGTLVVGNISSTGGVSASSFQGAGILLTSLPISATQNASNGYAWGIGAPLIAQSIILGTSAGASATSPGASTIAGYQAAQKLLNASELTAYGYQGCQNITSGLGNTCIGFAAGRNPTGASAGNTFGGAESGGVFSSGSAFNHNTGWGFASLNKAGADDNTGVGYQAGILHTGARSTFLGQQSGNTASSGNNELCLGSNSCGGLTTGSGNIGIGQGQSFVSATASNQFQLQASLTGSNISSTVAAYGINFAAGTSATLPGLAVSGSLVVSGTAAYIQTFSPSGTTPVACAAGTEGALAYSFNNHYQCFCDGTSWKQSAVPLTACTF